MKHFIAIHRFHNDEKRKEYCMSPELKDLDKLMKRRFSCRGFLAKAVENITEDSDKSDKEKN